MRKITSYLSLPVISGSQHKILGTITGVLCEKRLKSVGFFAFSDLYSKDSENMYVAARSLKKINDDSVVLSNLLCIKSQYDVSGKDLIEFPLGAPVYTADGKALGVLSDLYFGDTDKIATAIIVNETPVLVERIASVDAQGVLLLPDGKKRVRKQKSKPVIEKPEKDFSRKKNENQRHVARVRAIRRFFLWASNTTFFVTSAPFLMMGTLFLS